MNNYDTITTTDKAKRDDIFRQMRESTDPLERASVKFSSNEIILGPDGLPETTIVMYRVSGPKHSRVVTFKNHHTHLLGPRGQSRLRYRSTWSVATPRPKPGYNA
jgi:hypothetical protein